MRISNSTWSDAYFARSAGFGFHDDRIWRSAYEYRVVQCRPVRNDVRVSARSCHQVGMSNQFPDPRPRQPVGVKTRHAPMPQVMGRKVGDARNTAGPRSRSVATRAAAGRPTGGSFSRSRRRFPVWRIDDDGGRSHALRRRPSAFVHPVIHRVARQPISFDEDGVRSDLRVDLWGGQPSRVARPRRSIPARRGVDRGGVTTRTAYRFGAIDPSWRFGPFPRRIPE